MKQLLTLLLWAASCASASGSALAAAPEGEKNATQLQGFVAIRVFANTPDTEPHTWTHLSVLSAAEKEFTLELKTSTSRHTSKIFAGYLPEGNYRLKRLVGLQSKPELGPGFDFAVRPRALTNLGTLIYQPVGAGKATFVTYDKQAELARSVSKEFPALAQDLSDTTVTGWRQVAAQNQAASGQAIPASLQFGLAGAAFAGLVNKMAETDKRLAWADAKDPALRLMLSKTSTYSLNAAQELPDGALLAGSNLGQLLLRSQSGEWSNIDVDDPREITALHARSGAHITVGGEEGLLKQSSDGGMTWTDLEFPVDDGLILHLTQVDGELLAMSVAQGRVYLHSRLTTPGSRWRELTNLPGIGAVAHAMMPSRAVVHNGKYYLILPGKEIHAFDFASRTWTVSSVPQQIQEIGSNGESMYSLGFFQKPHVSQDSGASWSRIDHACSGIVHDFAMLDKNNAWSLCHVGGAFVASSRLRQSKDGGLTWSDSVQETALKSTKMVAKKSVVLYIDRDARIFSSSDGGHTWSQDKRKLTTRVSGSTEGVTNSQPK